MSFRGWPSVHPNPVSGVSENSRDVHHRYKKKHRDPKQQAGPAHLNFCGNAQRRGQQRKSDEIRPKQSPRHISGTNGSDKSPRPRDARRRRPPRERRNTNCSRLRSCRGRGPARYRSRSPQRNKEKHDASAAHRNDDARDLKKYDEKGCGHRDAKREPVCSERQIVKRRAGEGIFCGTGLAPVHAEKKAARLKPAATSAGSEFCCTLCSRGLFSRAQKR